MKTNTTFIHTYIQNKTYTLILNLYNVYTIHDTLYH